MESRDKTSDVLTCWSPLDVVLVAVPSASTFTACKLEGVVRDPLFLLLLFRHEKGEVSDRVDCRGDEDDANASHVFLVIVEVVASNRNTHMVGICLDVDVSGIVV